MIMETQPCTWQPIFVSCQWWSTWSEPVDLMWRPLTRLECIVCCLSDASSIINMMPFCNIVCTCTPVDMVHYYTTSSDMSVPSDSFVSLTSCAVGQHSTFESSTGRPCRDNSRSARKWKQCPGAEQCRLTNGYVVLLWSSMFVHWNLQIVPQILPKKLLPSSVP